MPTLQFGGKPLVYSHHLTVPVRTLQPVAAKSVHAGKKTAYNLDDNLIIHGDNLEALKALMPRYADKVNCIYIDPPYNTGNEEWVYNDNVNAPRLQAWLKNNAPVDGDDMERHDKWLCMMWPRLQILRDLLAEDGVIFISIDDNEQHRLRMMMDDIFGEENFISQFVWHKKNVVQNDAQFASVNHEYILCYRRSEQISKFNLMERGAEANDRYKNPDNDPRGVWQSVALQAKSGKPESVYSVKFANGVKWSPPAGTYPKFSKKRLLELYQDGRLWFGAKGNNVPRLKKYLTEVQQGVVASTLLKPEAVGSTQAATELLKKIMAKNVFSSPKPPMLIQTLISLVTDKNSIILDSFAGSGTTAHATLALNEKDGGNRKFILVECEDYADKITAERVKRVIKGYKNGDATAKIPGLGGSFTYCTLGDIIAPKQMLLGKKLPNYDSLARHLIYVATGKSPAKIQKPGKDGFFYEDDHRLYYLIYEAKQEFLRGAASALDLYTAERIEKQAQKKQKAAIVYATHKFVEQKELASMAITFCAIPYNIYQKAA